MINAVQKLYVDFRNGKLMLFLRNLSLVVGEYIFHSSRITTYERRYAIYGAFNKASSGSGED